MTKLVEHYALDITGFEFNELEGLKELASIRFVGTENGAATFNGCGGDFQYNQEDVTNRLEEINNAELQYDTGWSSYANELNKAKDALEGE